MEKSTLISTLVLAMSGIIALNIKQIINFISEYTVRLLFYSINVNDSSPFYYAMQRYVRSEKIEKVKNFYYKNFWDNWLSKIENKGGRKSENLFFDYGYFFLKFNGKLIFLTKTTRVIDNSFDPWKNTRQSIALYSFNRKAIFDLLNHIEKTYYNDTINYYFNSDGETKLLGAIGNKTFDHIFLNDNLVDNIKEDVTKFIKNEEKYRSLGIKYKRTYLFYGPAGTGKSSLATAIANYSRRNILSINISKDMTDATLIKVIASRPDNCIILFEDIDCLFTNLKRETDTHTENTDIKHDNKKEDFQKVTLSCILNILDGSLTPENVIFILTTNHIDKLDEALKRDGRTDVKLEIRHPNNDTIEKYLNYVSNKIGKSVNIDITPNTSLATLEKLLI